jgi:hypothetical protein
VQATHRGDDAACVDTLARRVRGVPASRVGPPLQSSQGPAEADLAAIDPWLGDLLDMATNLGLTRKQSRPVRIRRERQRIQMRGHVAGRARIGVVAPGAADRAGLLDDAVVADADAVECVRHREAAETGADDEHIDLFRQPSHAELGDEHPGQHPDRQRAHRARARPAA